MTIQEAINTGKPFRIRRGDDWLIVNDTKDIVSINSKLPVYIRADEAVSMDWEVEEEKKEARARAYLRDRGFELQVVFVKDGYSAGPDWTRAPWLDEPEDK